MVERISIRKIVSNGVHSDQFDFDIFWRSFDQTQLSENLQDVILEVIDQYGGHAVKNGTIDASQILALRILQFGLRTRRNWTGLENP